MYSKTPLNPYIDQNFRIQENFACTAFKYEGTAFLYM